MCIRDRIVKHGILPDDDIRYITKAGAPEFFPVDSEQERKLVFTISPEDRKEVIEHNYYDEFYSNDS